MKKISIKELKQFVREMLEEYVSEAGASDTKRSIQGYDLEDGDDFDMSGKSWIKGKEEGVTQAKRAEHGYALEEPVDMDVAGGDLKENDMSLTRCIKEVGPPGEKAEKFIKKSKKDFQKRYGPRWREVLYKTAWDRFGDK